MAAEEPTAALRAGYRALLVDLDGVVQLGDRPVDNAAASLDQARSAGLAVAFITNNAARPPDEVVDRLARVGVRAELDEVVTSSMAAADVLADRLPPGVAVLVVGGPGLRAAVAAAGFAVTDSADDEPAAVVQGWGPDVGWPALAEASVAVRAGALWVATNLDRTLPTERGPLPGAGSLVEVVTAATGAEPALVAGKPARPLFDAARRRVREEPALVVGDRLDTDIAGAVAAGLDSLLVLTGVSGPADLLAAPPEARPSHVGRDLTALGCPSPPARLDGDSARCRAATVSADGELTGRAGPDGLDHLRAGCALAWAGRLEEPARRRLLGELALD